MKWILDSFARSNACITHSLAQTLTLMKVYIPQKYEQRWQHKTHQIIRLNKSTMGDRGLIQIIGLCDIVKASNNKQLSEITEQ